MVDLNILKGDYSSQDVVFLVKDVFESAEPLDLISIMMMVQTIVPLYPSLGITTRMQLVEIIENSFTFFSQLVSFTISIGPKRRETNVFKTVILEVLRRGHCLHQYIKLVGNRKVERNTIKSLFFGSRLFNLLVSEIDISNYLEILRIQWVKVIMEYTSLEDALYGSLMASMLALHSTISPNVVFGQLALIDDDHYSGFKVLVKNSTLLDQKRIVKSMLSYLDIRTNPDNYKSVWLILDELPLTRVLSLDTILSLRSSILQEVVLRKIPRTKDLSFLLPLIKRFSECLPIDDIVCRIFVIMLKFQMDSTERNAVSKNADFLDAVTRRLAHEDFTVRERTMYVAKVVTDGKLQYQSDFKISIPELDFSDITKIADYTALQNATSSSAEIANTIPTRELDHIHISDELEPIVFVKDLIKRFDSEGTKKVVPLLQSTVKLIRQKKDFPLEVLFHWSTLVTSISTLNNNLDEPNFEDWRINALVSLLVIAPTKVQDLQGILFNSELSLQQRLAILSGMAFAARELRGFDNGSIIIAPQYSFPTERLPWDRSLPSDDPPISHSVLTTFQQVWRSRKLDNALQSNDKNNFKHHACTFFYPLAYGWLNGIELGTYDKLFKRHYLRTLSMIYECCYPHRDYNEMREIMLQLSADGLQQGIEL